MFALCKSKNIDSKVLLIKLGHPVHCCNINFHQVLIVINTF